VKPYGEYIYIFMYCILPYFKILYDGPMVVINYRNTKLFLNKGSCVQSVSKQYVFKHFTNTMGSTPISHSIFNVLNIMMGIGYIMGW
jgi:hypothetical protein